MATYQRERASLPPKEQQRRRGQILALDMSGTQTYATHPAVQSFAFSLLPKSTVNTHLLWRVSEYIVVEILGRVIKAVA
jgi:hypothetical protein